MSTQIAGIEQASSVRFDLQRIGVKAAVIDKMRSDCEGADLQRLRCFHAFGANASGTKSACTHDALDSWTHHNRDVSANLWNQPPMIAMPMRKDNCE
jgi:hypothetical protein